MINIRKSFSTKLSLSLLLLAVPIFMVSIVVLYRQSRYIIKTEAMEHANSVLDNTMQHVLRYLSAVETATEANSWLIVRYLQPDSLLALSNRIVRLNPHIDGCSISTEPDMFPQYGRYFSAYTIQDGDSIITTVEEPYEYFDKVWYKMARDEGRECWVNFYDETDLLEVALKGMIASFSKPIYDDSGRFVAIISTDLSLFRMSKVIASEKPYPNSYFMMVDNEGHYFIHPDSTRLFDTTIFTGTNPEHNADIIALGHEMTAGNSGNMRVVIDGVPSLVCYQPVPRTSWSLALVCPESDILGGYRQLKYILVPLLILGLIAILLLCHRTVAHAIRPLDTLLDKTQSIATGNLEVYIPKSKREDAVGQLQNSFATMLQNLNFHMGSVRFTTELAQNRNEELAQATRQVEEADKQKTAFIQNVSHQIRTPLNIIMGFAQVLSDMSQTNSDGMAEEEMKLITDMMNYNSLLLSRMVMMLFDSSDTGLSEELNSHHNDMVSCVDVAHEAISYVTLHYPELNIGLESDVPEDFCINTNRLYLMRSLRELLYNAAKYSDRQHVVMRITHNDSTVSFIVEDTGKGIDKTNRELMFKFFTKVDDLSEGLGLGLPLAKRHALNLGGDLRLDDTYHDGCRFILDLPLA